jgi:hypothetical protein
VSLDFAKIPGEYLHKLVMSALILVLAVAAVDSTVEIERTRIKAVVAYKKHWVNNRSIERQIPGELKAVEDIL